MKRKLNIVFILMAFSLLGIIIFQIYWTVNAYQVNKGKFDANIDTAMHKAMGDCKKDYFDSIRRVLIKRLSPPELFLNIDTLPGFGTSAQYDILFLHKNTLPGTPYTTTQFKLDYYRAKINHKATLPEVLVEMSFYEPTLMQYITGLISAIDYGFTMVTTNDINNNPTLFRSTTYKGKSIIAFAVKYKTHDSLTNHQSAFYKHERDSAIKSYFKSNMIITAGKKEERKPIIKQLKSNNSLPFFKKKQVQLKPTPQTYKTPDIYLNPPNYQKNDSIKLYNYYKTELEKIHIYSPFKLLVSTQTMAASNLNLHYSETQEYNYKYHGFKVFGLGGEGEIFVRAQFLNPQYDILRRMLMTLVLSIFLVAFTIFCFNYIFRTFIEQRKLAELKDDFINNMTHELKTPIATITVAIEGLQKFNVLDDAEKTQRYLQTSRDELSRLNNLVTKVLDIAAFENNEIKLVRETITIDDLINDVIVSERLKTTKKTDIHFINKGDFVTVNADKFHFRNVLINLVDNAVKYSREPVQIVISCYKKDYLHCISIKDNGIGIPSDHVGLVFDKFHRVPTGNVHSVKGTGLGLSYVRYIVEAHGGSISVKSEVNKGSEFIILIP